MNIAAQLITQLTSPSPQQSHNISLLMIIPLRNITLIPLEFLHSYHASVRNAREAYLIERDHTLEPPGTNKKDEM